MQKMWGNAYRTTIVCVDGMEHGVLRGRLYNPYLPSGVRFDSLMEFFLSMEDLLDGMHFPQSFTAARNFQGLSDRPGESVTDSGPPEGKRGTFAVRVLFRQNASWQGSVSWLEGGRDESFRSALELVLMMHGALQDPPHSKETTKQQE